MKRLKESITSKEFKKLMAHLRGDEQIRANTKSNFEILFTILYYSGMRINEVQQLKVKDIQNFLKNDEMVIYAKKTHSERKIFISKDFKRDLKKCYRISEDPEHKIIQRAGHPRSSVTDIGLIAITNKYIQDVLGKNFTSHSFRQGLLSEMGEKGINVKIMSSFIGHSDLKTTLRYVKPTDEMIMKNLVR